MATATVTFTASVTDTLVTLCPGIDLAFNPTVHVAGKPSNGGIGSPRLGGGGGGFAIAAFNPNSSGTNPITGDSFAITISSAGGGDNIFGNDTTLEVVASASNASSSSHGQGNIGDTLWYGGDGGNPSGTPDTGGGQGGGNATAAGNGETGADSVDGVGGTGAGRDGDANPGGGDGGDTGLDGATATNGGGGGEGDGGAPGLAASLETRPYVAITYTLLASGPANLKTWGGVAKASVKTVNGIALGSVKTVNSI